MDFLNVFGGLNEIAQATLLLSIVAALGIALGNIRYRAVSLGIGGVLFAGILVGHFSGEVAPAAMHFIQEFGLILFVYTIGIQVGPGFFAAFRQSGPALNAMAAALVVMGSAVAGGIYALTDIPLPVVLGLFSGGVTNTPSLAAGQEMLRTMGAPAADLAMPGLGYAVAYPFGIAGILLAMGLIRLFLGINVDREAVAFEKERRSEVAGLEVMDVAVRNKNLDGVPVPEIPGLKRLELVVSRLMREGRVEVPTSESRIGVGDVLRIVGPRPRLKEMQMILGEPVQSEMEAAATDVRWERLVVTNSHILGTSLAELNATDAYHVVVSRVNRAGVELSPTPSLKFQFGDILTAIGTPIDIRGFAAVIGNSERRLQQVQLAPMFIGIALGVLLGSIPIYLPGMPAALKLGLAGGPLIVALVLSRVGHIGPMVWFMPPVANHALREFGIVLFLAVVGLKSGDRFFETLVHGDGLAWMAAASLITLVPLLVVGFFARLVMKTNYLTVCGLLAGSMTDPPALAFANQISPSEAPALAYATVYPLVMCLRILAPQILVLIFWAGL
ncbi:MAG: putative transporter [Rhodospirillales bacterium]|nr:putative transporter [Rhodospirillales bacterium]